MARFLYLLAAGLPLWAAPANDFQQSVAPLLQARCGECHSAKVKNSGFSIATLETVIAGGNKYGRAVVEGHPENSPLLKLLKGDLKPGMPFGQPLAKAEIDRIESWIRSLPPSKVQTSEWRWPFEKPVKHDPPAPKNAAWVRNPIDAFVLAKLDAESLVPAPPASSRTLVRRLYQDLIGLPPTPDEMNAFLADTDPAAW